MATMAEPDPDDPETWAFPGPPDFSGVMPADLPDVTMDPLTAAEAAADAFDSEEEATRPGRGMMEP
jgi:hypothetical protein